MKRFKRIIAATVVASFLGLSGCDAINEGYEIGMATVEFVETQENIFSTVAGLEQRLSNVEELGEIVGVQQQVIDELKAQQQTILSGDANEMLKQMSGFLVEDVVMMLENNVMMLNHLAPLHMSIGERFDAIASMEGYQEHKDKLLALQQSTQELASHIDGDVSRMAGVIAQSALPEELQMVVVESLKAFNGEYKNAILGQFNEIPATVAQELKWIDYVFEHKNLISVDENDELIFANQQALDQYNALFSE